MYILPKQGASEGRRLRRKRQATDHTYALPASPKVNWRVCVCVCVGDSFCWKLANWNGVLLCAPMSLSVSNTLSQTHPHSGIQRSVGLIYTELVEMMRHWTLMVDEAEVAVGPAGWGPHFLKNPSCFCNTFLFKHSDFSKSSKIKQK